MSLTAADGGRASVPPLAFLLSLLCLAVPVVVSSLLPGWTFDEGVLIWLLVLIPAFLLSFYRGWRGASTALAAAMAAYSLTHALLLVTQAATPPPIIMVAGTAIMILVSLGSGWLAERFRESLRRAEEQALTDAGTGLPNRRHTMLHLQRAFAAAERGGTLSVVVFDIDHFKRINDDHGHQTGDEVLKTFASVLAGHTRDMNISGRFGGEEFVSVLEGVDARGAEMFGERVRQAFASVTAKSAYGMITTSAGVAEFEHGMASPEVLIAAADQALYRAKGSGRNRTVVLGRVGSHGGTTVRLERDAVSPARRGSGEVVLVVDDDAAVLRVLMKTLKMRGYSPIGAADPHDALAIAVGVQEPIALVIVDIIMPAMSGFRFVEMFEQRLAATRVLYISGYQRDDVDWSGVPGAVKAFLPKPITVERLMESVHSMLHAPLQTETASARRAVRNIPDELQMAVAAKSAQLEGAHAEMLYRLAWAAEFRDDETGQHAQRVGSLASRLAAVMGRPPEECAVLELTAPLHDVGKIAVPDAILHKPGPLTPLEREIMQAHCAAGARILGGSRNALLQTAEIIALHHHEWWDGSGYPFGIAADAIPYAARVTAVADAYDALTHIRPYRQRLETEQAFNRIQLAAGTQFDPAVVDALALLYVRGQLESVDRIDLIGSAHPRATAGA